MHCFVTGSLRTFLIASTALADNNQPAPSRVIENMSAGPKLQTNTALMSMAALPGWSPKKGRAITGFPHHALKCHVPQFCARDKRPPYRASHHLVGPFRASRLVGQARIIAGHTSPQPKHDNLRTRVGERQQSPHSVLKKQNAPTCDCSGPDKRNMQYTAQHTCRDQSPE